MSHRERFLAAAALLIATGVCIGVDAASPKDSLSVRVEAGKYDRRDCPVRVIIRDDWLGPEVIDALDCVAVAGQIAVTPTTLHLTPDDASGKPIIVQAERTRSGSRDIRLSWVIPGPIAAGERKTYRLDTAHNARAKTPWQLTIAKDSYELRHDDRPVFRYNTAPISSPAYGPIQHRDAYIHPAYSPSGALVTGDFSPFHPHHRGFFLAYAKAQVGDQLLDFWNIHTNKGKIRTAGFEARSGAVCVLISAAHHWEDKSGKIVLREQWDLEPIAVPGAPYWLFDLTSTQQAVDKPFEILPYRYGGMAYRGPEPFVKGKLDVLTAEGRHRVDGNLQPTRWVDMTGPVADGSTTYAGAMIADHPGNIHHPTVVRIHPITLPFFSFVPASKEKIVIDAKTPLVFRYRVMIHDGHPDAALDECIWRDFAEPPRVTMTAD